MEGSSRPALGEQETRVLLFVTERGAVPARIVAEHFAVEAGLARTTTLTVLERLRTKGYLVRRKVGASYQYAPEDKTGGTARDVVGGFVERSLGGSVSPLLAYLADAPHLSTEEIEQLRRLVEELDDRSA
ncbi:BlaI/MecI/CopY family transcriptional regulator [bacterium]|nr:MAG: BlaI/MecI/CopY family transcriptional regulator [bacterium]